MIHLYVITRVLTFFGTEMRVFWEHLVCRVAKIVAEDIRAFKVSELCGHVEHELLRTKKQAFLMCWLPFTLNFILGVLLLLSGSYRIIYLGNYAAIKYWVFLYVGVSCLANCAPSFEDILSFKDMFYSKDSSVALKVLLAPFFGVAYAMAFLERYSITFILAIAFAVAFPWIFNFVLPAISLLGKLL